MSFGMKAIVSQFTNFSMALNNQQQITVRTQADKKQTYFSDSLQLN